MIAVASSLPMRSFPALPSKAARSSNSPSSNSDSGSRRRPGNSDVSHSSSSSLRLRRLRAGRTSASAYGLLGVTILGAVFAMEWLAVKVRLPNPSPKRSRHFLALDRTAPTQPMLPGVPSRQTHGHVRHRATNLYATLDRLPRT